MKKGLLTIFVCVFGIISCKDDDINLFEKSGDERTAEAIAALKDKLTEPANGWRLKYEPVDGSGSFYILIKFNENNTVNIQSDVAPENGAYFNQENTYRIDSSLGLELIIESYSAFSYLFEHDQATFLAEYEFNYIEETPEGALVFKSKTDPSNPTEILFEQANAQDIGLLGQAAASKLDSIVNDFDKFTSTQQLTFPSRGISFDVSVNFTTRVIEFKAVSLISDRTQNISMDFSTGYLVEGNTILFNDQLSGTFFGNSIAVSSIQVADLTAGTLDFCGVPHPINGITGTTSQGDLIHLESSFLDIAGQNFFVASQEFFGPLYYIFDGEGVPQEEQIRQDIQGVEDIRLFYNYDLGGGEKLFAMGFLILGENEEVTFALYEFTPVMENNRIVFQFADEISIFRDPTTANLDNIKTYLNALTEGGQTHMFELFDGVYELHNPCTGWSAIFY